MSTSADPTRDLAPPQPAGADPVLDAIPAVAPAGAGVFAPNSPRRTEVTPAVEREPAGLPRGLRLTVDWVSWCVTSVVAVAFFVLIVSGRVVTEGPVLLVLSATHGIHEGDLFALTAACAAIAVPLLRGIRRR